MPLEELLKLYSGEIDDDTHIGKCDNVMETESLKKGWTFLDFVRHFITFWLLKLCETPLA